eukprot:365337-Chlamydomonas_euryale.AAC.8
MARHWRRSHCWDWEFWETPLLGLGTLGKSTAGTGNPGKLHCWDWESWQAPLLGLGTLGKSTAGTGNLGKLNCWDWQPFEPPLLGLGILGSSIPGPPGSRPSVSARCRTLWNTYIGIASA